MENFRKNIGRMFWLLFVLFLAMGAYFVWFAAVGGRDTVANPFNARVNMEMDGRRGAIYDRNRQVLARSVALDDGGYVREYPFGSIFAHSVGYSGVSRAGLELTQNFALQNLNRELWQRLGNVFFGDEMMANSVHSTLDADVQRLAHDTIAANGRGAAVVLDVRTGAVLAMVSLPSFDPNDVVANWSGLIGDGSAPLLNRATSGLYPPGSTFKLITALAAMEYNMDLLDFSMHCTGHHIFGEQNLQCFGGTAHGYVDFSRAMALSCNGYFAHLAEMIPARHIINAAESAGFFNQILDFELNVSMPQFLLPLQPERSELIETAIGQGRTTATPLNMAVFAAAIANGGVAPQPHLVSHIAGVSDNVVRNFRHGNNGRVMRANYAEILAQSMVDAVNFGTASLAAVANMQTAGKTGTAQNETGIDHSWFIGFAPADEPQIALAIIMENTSGGTRATQLAGRIFALAIE
ncbi:MAG: penicillin-binding transpeptidase domain-containing protein [Defluviitaleaceae bacterium]|nr:penicillin-binding transpeptidase domain-containing protein [Defluviitaleaceae bacterium]